MPPLLSSLQLTQAFDAPLAALQRFVSTSTDELPPSIAQALVQALAPLAAAYPHAPTRHALFYTLSGVIARAPPPVRLALLLELLADSSLPQLRAAAVGLVRNALLEGHGVFASPQALQALAPHLFLLPPGTIEMSAQDLLETQEPARLTAVLSLLYALLKRDEKNKVRTNAFVAHV